MARILFFVTFVLTLLFCAFGAWYLMHPETWNTFYLRGLLSAGKSSTPDVAEVVSSRQVAERSGAVPVQSSNEVSIPIPARALQEEVSASVCGLPEGVKVTTRGDFVYYSWRDEKGTINISSEPPASANTQVRRRTFLAPADYFSLDIEYRGAGLIPDYQRELDSRANGIYRVLSRLIGEENLRQVDLNIVVYPDRASYLAYARQVTGRNMDYTSGFYSSKTNEATVYVQPQREVTLQISLHEATHVIETGALGLVPIWLNEGLADYFSHLLVNGSGTTVAVDRQALQRAQEALSSGYVGRPRDLMALTPETWRMGDKEKHYALAWAVVFFMMSSDEGRTALSSVLGEIAAQYCVQLDTNAVLDGSYPGGIGKLERDFVDWLMNNRAVAGHSF